MLQHKVRDEFPTMQHFIMEQLPVISFIPTIPLI